MGIKRIVDTSFWTDDKVMDLFSPEDKYFMLYLMTNPHTTQLGIYKVNIKYIALELGYSQDTIKVLLDRFENKYRTIKYSSETQEIAIKNYLKYSIVKGGAPVRDLLIKEIRAVKDKNLIVWVFSNVKDVDGLNETVKNIIGEYELKNGLLYYCNEKQNDNENDNDNEVSYHDSYNDTLNDSLNENSKQKTKKERNKTSYDEILDELQSDQLKEALLEFIKARKMMKKPLTNRALKLCIQKLFSLTNDEDEMIQIVNNSIMNSWQGFFPLKGDYKQKQGKGDDLAF